MTGRYQQASFDFTRRRENNRESQSILQASSKQINRQCMRVLELLDQGIRLTVNGAVIDYGISSLPRRIKDLKDKWGIPVRSMLITGQQSKFKEYFLIQTGIYISLIKQQQTAS